MIDDSFVCHCSITMIDDSLVCHCVIPDAVSNATKLEPVLEFRRRTKSGRIAWSGIHGKWSITEQARFADFLWFDLIDDLIVLSLQTIQIKVMKWWLSAGNPLWGEDPWTLHSRLSLLGEARAFLLESPLCVARRKHCDSVRKTDKLSATTCFVPTAQCIGPLIHSLLKFFDAFDSAGQMPLPASILYIGEVFVDIGLWHTMDALRLRHGCGSVPSLFGPSWESVMSIVNWFWIVICGRCWSRWSWPSCKSLSARWKTIGRGWGTTSRSTLIKSSLKIQKMTLSGFKLSGEKEWKLIWCRLM